MILITYSSTHLQTAASLPARTLLDLTSLHIAVNGQIPCGMSSTSTLEANAEWFTAVGAASTCRGLSLPYTTCLYFRGMQMSRFVQLASPAHLELQRGNWHSTVAYLVLQSSQTPFRLSNSAILHQHRKLQQHSYNISGADLDAKGTTDAHPRLQHHRQARSAPGFTNQSQPSHTHTNEPGISQVSRQQHGAVLESDTHAAVSDTRMSHFTQTDSVMEQVLYPNSPQWRQNDTQWHHVHESYVEQLASGQVGIRHA